MEDQDETSSHASETDPSSGEADTSTSGSSGEEEREESKRVPPTKKAATDAGPAKQVKFDPSIPSARNERVLKLVRGQLNRLSEENLEKIARDVAAMFEEYSHNGMRVFFLCFLFV